VLTFVVSDRRRPTRRLWSCGFPANAQNHVYVSSGEYAGIMKDEESGDWLQYHGLIQPGDSGGPVIDATGRVVGWNVRNPQGDPIFRKAGVAGNNHVSRQRLLRGIELPPSASRR
jgi:hypothetical protein